MGFWAPYVPVAIRRRQAAAEMAALAKDGGIVPSPVQIEGRKIATTAWGAAWCAHLDRLSDYANRLPRGRTYVRNGSVVHLVITPGRVDARVSGSSLYRTTITVDAVPAAHWRALCADCGGHIDSIVELLQGRIAAGVMRRLCQEADGLFPTPRQIRFDCSCPDSAAMCKHVAAVLYGVGARLDSAPQLLFTLRQVEPTELLRSAGRGLAAAPPSGSSRVLTSDVADVFGLELDEATPASPAPVPPASRSRVRATAPPATAAPSASARARADRTASRRTRVDPQTQLRAALQRDGSLTLAQVRAASGLRGVAVRRLLQALAMEGLVRIERRGGTRYIATGGLAGPTGSASRAERRRQRP